MIIETAHSFWEKGENGEIGDEWSRREQRAGRRWEVMGEPTGARPWKSRAARRVREPGETKRVLDGMRRAETTGRLKDEVVVVGHAPSPTKGATPAPSGARSVGGPPA